DAVARVAARVARRQHVDVGGRALHVEIPDMAVARSGRTAVGQDDCGAGAGVESGVRIDREIAATAGSVGVGKVDTRAERERGGRAVADGEIALNDATRDAVGR